MRRHYRAQSRLFARMDSRVWTAKLAHETFKDFDQTALGLFTADGAPARQEPPRPE